MNTFQKTIKVIAIIIATTIIITIFSLLIYTIENILTINQKDKNITFQKTYSNVERIKIEAKTANIIVTNGKKLNIKSKNIKSNFKEYENNNKIRIEETNSIFKKEKEEKAIIIEIPKNNSIKELSLEITTGLVEIDNIKIQNLEIEQGAGALTINNSKFNETEIDGGLGKITIDSSTLNNLKLSAGVGKIDIESKITGNSEIECGVGETNITLLDSQNNYTIETEKGIGSITIQNEEIKTTKTYGTGENKLKIEGGIGKIKVQFYE